MALATILATFSICVSGGLSNQSLANSLEMSQEKSIEIINNACSSIIFNDYKLTKEQQESIAQQDLLEYYDTNNLLNDAEISSINKYFLTNENYICRDDLISQLTTTHTQSKSKNNNFNFLIDNNGGGCSSQSQEKIDFKLHDFDETKVDAYWGGNIGEDKFYGLTLTKHTCIWLYNTVSEYFNRQAFLKVSGVPSIFGTIYNLFKNAPAAYSNSFFSSMVAELTSYLTSIFKTILKFLTSTTVGIIVAALLIMVSFLALFIFTVIMILGFYQLGLRFGILRKGLFNYEWIWETLDF